MTVIKVNGMHCENCKNAVENAVKAIPGIKSATVNLDKKELQYEEETKPVDTAVIVQAIRDLGFEPEE